MQDDSKLYDTMAQAQENQNTGPSMSRRDVLKTGAMTGAMAVSGPAAVDHVAPRYSPIGRASAIAPIVAGVMVFTGGAVVGTGAGAAAAYGLSEYLGDDDGASKSETHSDIYREATLSHGYLSSVQSKWSDGDLEDSTHIAWSDANVAVVDALNDGKPASEAKLDARAEIDEYYSRVIQNIISDWNLVCDNAAAMVEAAHANGFEPSDGGSGDVIHYIEAATGNCSGWSLSGPSYSSSCANHAPILAENCDTVRRDYTLPNGETIDLVEAVGEKDLWGTYWGIRIKAPDSSLDNLVFVSSYEWHDLVQDVKSKCSDLKNEVDAYVDGVYDNYDPDEIDPSEYLSPTDILREYQMDTDSPYSHSAVHLSQMGYPSKLDAPMTIKLDDGTEYEGILASRAKTEYGTYTTDEDGNEVYEPHEELEDGRWYAGHTYDPADYSEDILFVDSKNGKRRNISQPFEIVEITDLETGELVDSIALTEHNYQIQDPNRAQENIETNKELRDEAGEHESLWGGAGAFIPNDIPRWVFLVPGGALILGLFAALAGGE